MSEAAIRKALETRLSIIAGPLATAWDNADFDPTPGTPYQRVALLTAETENPAQGSVFTRYLGILQITLMYPTGDGASNADVRAELIRAWFPRNLSLVNSGVTVTIDKTPYKMTGFVDGDRWAVPIRIPYYANVP